MDDANGRDIIAEERPPLEFVEVAAEGGPYTCPEEYRARVMINVIHDGAVIPPEFLVDTQGVPIPGSAIYDAYVRERDWGASDVAEQLAIALGIDGYYKVNTARVLMDFGRFPGMSRQQPEHLQRFAINYPFSTLLSYDQKRRLLERHYDCIAEGMDQAVQGKLINLALHSYDRLNESGTERPQISLVTRTVGYQLDSRMPVGVFDYLYPDVLGEFTCNRVLRDRISLTMEKAGLPVAHNYPYLLPEGSLEVRAQVWFFFSFLRGRFEIRFPGTRKDPAFQKVWTMLLDTNLRSSESEILRSYLHMFRRAPQGREAEFRQAQLAYERVADYLQSIGKDVVDEYRHAQSRPSSLGLEVRKDLLWELDEREQPVRRRSEMAGHIARVIARAICVFLTEDREAKPAFEEGIGKRDSWYYRGVPRDWAERPQSL